jgi:hypothetical protein
MFFRSTALLSLIFLFFLSVGSAAAQTSTGAIHGRVTDPSGAVVQNANVTATPAGGKALRTTSNAQGVYELNNLAPGSYTVTVSAKGFAPDAEPGVNVSAGMPMQFDIALHIDVEKQQLEVQGNSNTIDTSSENNASALIIKGKDLDALSDDPDELSTELEALAGPAAGPNGGQIYIDGFTGGQLPPKASIREIRVNQNPFSAEYDKLGYGRIEIFTKPGLDQFHGQLFVLGNDNNFNAKNPFATRNGATIPPYHSEQFSGNLSGPLISKKASFFVNAERRNINDEAVVNAETLDPTTFNSVGFTQAVSTPRTRTNISPRLDFQLTPTNTLTARYQYWLDNEGNQGVSGFSLPSLGYNSRSVEHTFQLSDTQILSPTVINETRFEYERDLSQENPLNLVPEITVQGAFSTGGSAGGFLNDHQDHYELQNYTSVVHGKHMFKFGGRLRATRDANYTNSNFNGTYTFSSLQSYAITEYYLAQNPNASMADIQAICTLPPGSNITPQAGQCGGPSQYTQTIGTPAIVSNYVDAGLYLQDEYKIRPNLTLSYGLRFETQNVIQDHGDFAPRVGLAWGIGGGKGAAKTVLRAGYGIFYERFPITQILNTERFNGTNQQEYVVTSPLFFNPNGSVSQCDLTSCSVGTLSRASEYQMASNLRAPYTMQSAVSLERQLWKNATGALTYINSRGVHQLVTINANAPFPGTYDPADPAAAIYPYGYNGGNIYQYYTEGVFKQNQLIANIQWRAGSRFSLFGNYSLNYAASDVNGSAGFATNSYDILQDYGRAAFSTRSRFMLGGSFSLPYAFRFSPFMIASSGAPYNITVGQDLNGDSIFNDRAYICSDPASPSCRQGYTTSPLGNTLVPVNTGVGPAAFTFNMRFGKTFGVGPKKEKAAADAGGPPPPGGGGHGGGGPRGGGNPFGGGMGGHGGMFGGDATNRKYSLTFNVLVRNLFNNVNEAAPIGNVNSPFFAHSIALGGGPFGSGAYNRRVDLQAMFSF